MSEATRPPLELPPSSPVEPPPDLGARLGELGVSLDPTAIKQLAEYLGHLLGMNTRMNLTAIRSPAEAWDKHVLDALTLIPLLAETHANAKVLDVGSGGGVPGIPVAIARPDLRVTLLDATQKKIAFLSGVSAAIGLGNVDAIAGRAEQLAQTKGARSFDVVTARAVGRLSLLVSLTAPFAKRGGLLLLIKGQRAEEELAEAEDALREHKLTHEKTVATPTGRILVLRAG